MNSGSPEPVQQRPADDEIHLREIGALLRRNLFLIFLCFFVVVGAVAAYTWTVVPVWETETTIRIEEERSEVPVLDILSSLSTGSQVETEMEVLRSRTLAEDVVRQLELQVGLETPRGAARAEYIQSPFAEDWAPEGVYLLERQSDGSFRVTDELNVREVDTFRPDEPFVVPGASFRLSESGAAEPLLRVTVAGFDQAVRRLQNSMTVSRPNREAGVVVARYESTDTVLVREVPNVLSSNFIQRRQQIQKTEARSTVGFLQQQIDTLSRQLTAAEDAMQAYQQGEQVVNLRAESEAQVTQLARIQASRNEMDAQRIALQRLMDEIDREAETLDLTDPDTRSPYRRLIGFPQLLQNQAASELLRSLNTVESQRSELLRRRTFQDPDVQQLTSRMREIEDQLQGIAQTYLDGLTSQVTSLDETLSRFSTELESIPEREVQMARLQRQTEVLEEIYLILQTRMKEAEIAEAVEDPSVRVIDAAILPVEPVRPRRALNLALGALLGLMLGVGLAFTREFLDDTVHTREDVEKATGGASILGMIPSIKAAGNGKRKKGDDPLAHLEDRLVTGRDPRNPVSEAYRVLRTNLTFATTGGAPRSIVFTSPFPQDGKSTTSANLAITLAQQGQKVLLIDADLRRGVLHSVFGVDREPGLSNVLVGAAQLGDCIERIALGESGTIYFLPTGALPPNPSELLGSEKMGQLVTALTERFDSVVMDCAPLTVVTDAALLGTKADGVVLVARANVTEKGALNYSADQLGNVRAPLLGVVLNDVDFRRDSRYSSKYGHYGYHYQAYYGENGERTGRKAKKS